MCAHLFHVRGQRPASSLSQPAPTAGRRVWIPGTGCTDYWQVLILLTPRENLLLCAAGAARGNNKLGFCFDPSHLSSFRSPQPPAEHRAGRAATAQRGPHAGAAAGDGGNKRRLHRRGRHCARAGASSAGKSMMRGICLSASADVHINAITRAQRHSTGTRAGAWLGIASCVVRPKVFPEGYP